MLWGKISSFFKKIGRGFKKAFVFGKSKWQRVDRVKLAFILNMAFAAFHGVLSFLERSVWFLMLAIYYASLAIVRGGIVMYQRREGKSERAQLKMYGRCGAFLVVISLALTVAVIQMVYINRTFSYTGLIIYAVAAYAFAKITVAIINLVKFKKNSDYAVRTKTNLNLANAMVSILALQTALLNEFSAGEVDPRIFNALSGSFVCLFTLGLGITMLVKSKIKIKELKRNGQI